jgi:Family of unknown function (DUF6644)
MLETLEWLENTGLARIVRESLYGFQIVVGIHILGLIFSVGLLLWMDLRMLGVCLTDRKLSEVYGALSRWFVAGFTVMILSGATIFTGFATSAYGNTYFRIKILLIVLAGINAVVFHLLLKRMPAHVDAGAPSAAVRSAGLLSILFWGAVIACGRMMSYTLF